METPALPPELSDRIIDYLHDDPNALARCALVASGWGATARYHRFTRTSVKCHELIAYFDLLNISPAAGLCVRRLTITGISTCNTCNGTFQVDTSGEDHDPTLIADIFARTPSLREFHALSLPLFMFIDSIPLTVTQLLLHEVRLSTLARVIRAFRLPSLHSLLIDMIDHHDSYRMSTSTALADIETIQNPAAFTELSLSIYGAVATEACKWLVVHGIGSRLRALAVHFFDVHMLEPYAQLFRTLGPSLTHLEMKCGLYSDWEVALRAEWALAECINLRHLRLTGFVARMTVPMENTFAFLRNLRAHCVTSLTFVVDLSWYLHTSVATRDTQSVESALSLLHCETYKKVRRMAWELHYNEDPGSMGGVPLTTLVKTTAAMIAMQWEGHYRPGMRFAITRVTEPAVPCAWDDGEVHPLGVQTIVSSTDDDQYCRWNVT